MITDQALNEHEWYNLYIASVHGYRDLIRQVGDITYSIPLVIYQRAALKNIGLSEIILRLPSIITGIFSLFFFPLLLNKTFNKITTVIFSVLMAISPFLINCSRDSQPYAIIMFLSFTAVLFFYFWLTSAKFSYLLIYIGTGAMTIFFHLFSAMAVLPPLFCAIIIKFYQHVTHYEKKYVNIQPGLPSLLILFCILFLPVMMTNSSFSFFNGLTITEINSSVFRSFHELAILLCGSLNWIAIVIFIFFIITGQFYLFKDHRLIGITFGSIFLVIFLFAISNNAVGSHSPEIIILILPIILLSAAVGFNALLELFFGAVMSKKQTQTEFSRTVFILSFMFLLLFTGPSLSKTAPSKNINTLESLDAYRLLNASSQYKDGDKVPDFYNRLQKDKKEFSIIEYPMIVPDHYTVYNRYQSVHKKDIYIGIFYSQAIRKQWFVAKTPDIENWPLEIILGEMANKSINLANIKAINLYDINALRNSNIKYIILHKYIMDEIFYEKQNSHDYKDVAPKLEDKLSRHIYNFSLHFSNYFQRYFGKPIFEDKWLIIFQI